MAKEPLSTRVEKSVAEEVEQEAEDQDISNSEYLREIILRRHENYQQVDAQKQTIEDLREQLAEEQQKNQEWKDLFKEHLRYMEQLQVIDSDTLRDDMKQLDQLRKEVIGTLEDDIEKLNEERSWMNHMIHEDINRDLNAVKTYLENFEEESRLAYIEEKQEELTGHYRTLERYMNRKPEPDRRIDINYDAIGLGKIVGAMLFGWILFGVVIPAIISAIVSFLPLI